MWAAECGQLEILKFLYNSGYKGCTKFGILDIACKGGNLQVVKYLHSINKKCTHMALDMAASKGHLEIVKFLHYNCGSISTNLAMDLSSANGHIEVVKFLHSVGKKCTKWALHISNRNNFIEIANFLKSIGCVDEYTF